ncbi:ADP-ribose pyrophosphatase YjhB, NUDIX family [Oceanobacillus limi]|uniref:ADP-ribose pyrophosphatase YjhB, NUDIX family n=1 Tax=Oceanobacillus limi TaxID=930131 RepID=A0A1I0GNB6_9BACI|nr:NUDIX hydrolase [Oceanobacillus limi]SET72523.1 ADP-ribose pyrophosphatase YjhB, NUDIX family [Oceanobacillus limi]
MSDQWLHWARRIQALAQSGMAFSKDEFDKERYQELRDISVEIMSNYSDLEICSVKNLFASEEGYQTPKLDVRGVVFSNDQLLLVKEKLDNKWSLPGGFCEVGLSPAENCVKEIKEEAGFDVTPIKLLALHDNNKQSHPPDAYHYYKCFIQCKINNGKASGGLETNEAKFFSRNNLPPLSTRRNTETQILEMFSFLKENRKESLFD